LCWIFKNGNKKTKECYIVRNLRITMIRHAKTDKVKPDANRRIVPEGESQAKRRRGLMGNPKFDFVIGSPLERTWQTARIIAGDENIPIVVIPALTINDDDEDVDVLNGVGDRIGYADLRTYWHQSSDAERIALINLGQRAWEAIVSAVIEEVGKRHLRADDDFDVLILGHAILLGFVILAAYNYDDMDALPPDEMLDIDFQECEGASFSWSGADCTDMKMLVG